MLVLVGWLFWVAGSLMKGKYKILLSSDMDAGFSQTARDVAGALYLGEEARSQESVGIWYGINNDYEIIMTLNRTV
jgi:hypothetical protein